MYGVKFIYGIYWIYIPIKTLFSLWFNRLIFHLLSCLFVFLIFLFVCLLFLLLLVFLWIIQFSLWHANRQKSLQFLFLIYSYSLVQWVCNAHVKNCVWCAILSQAGIVFQWQVHIPYHSMRMHESFFLSVDPCHCILYYALPKTDACACPFVHRWCDHVAFGKCSRHMCNAMKTMEFKKNRKKMWKRRWKKTHPGLLNLVVFFSLSLNYSLLIC